MDLFSPESFLFLSLLFFYLYFQFKNTSSNNKGFKNYPLLGALPEFLKNRHRFLEWTAEILSNCPTNTVVFFRPGEVPEIITANPNNVEHMLKTKFHNYPKGESFKGLHDFLGNGIFNSDGDLWKMQRKTASHQFNTKSLRNFVMQSVTTEIETRLLPILSGASEANRVLDMQDLLERFAFDNVCTLAFNVDPACLGCDSTAGAEFKREFEDAAFLSSQRFMSLLEITWKIKKFLNIGTERRLRESILTVHNFADKIIRSRLDSKGDTCNDDLLSWFIRTEDNSPEFLRNMVLSFILAGRDTTASALSWFFWILSSKPEVKEKIRNEIKSVRSVTAVGAFGYEELKEMHYLHAAISETMRLFPPVSMDSRTCLNDDVLPDGTIIRKGWFITYHTYAMGRLESVWGKDCNEFKPERWLENGLFKPESPFRFPVFHAGPRTCLGKELAYIQMKSIAASVLEKFEIEAVDKDTCPTHLLSVTLKIKEGLPVRVSVKENR